MNNKHTGQERWLYTFFRILFSFFAIALGVGSIVGGAVMLWSIANRGVDLVSSIVATALVLGACSSMIATSIEQWRAVRPHSPASLRPMRRIALYCFAVTMIAGALLLIWLRYAGSGHRAD